MKDSVVNKAQHTSSQMGRVLKLSNIHLQSSKARALRIRSLASSTAIETGESIADIESKLRKINPQSYRIKLR